MNARQIIDQLLEDDNQVGSLDLDWEQEEDDGETAWYRATATMTKGSRRETIKFLVNDRDFTGTYNLERNEIDVMAQLSSFYGVDITDIPGDGGQYLVLKDGSVVENVDDELDVFSPDEAKKLRAFFTKLGFKESRPYGASSFRFLSTNHDPGKQNLVQMDVGVDPKSSAVVIVYLCKSDGTFESGYKSGGKRYEKVFGDIDEAIAGFPEVLKTAINAVGYAAYIADRKAKGKTQNFDIFANDVKFQQELLAKLG